MKILAITNHFLPCIGGMQLSTHQTLTALAKQHASVTLYTANYPDVDSDFDAKLPYQVIRIGKPSYWNTCRRLFHLWLAAPRDKETVILLMGHEAEMAYALASPFMRQRPVILAGGTRLRFSSHFLKQLIRNALLTRAYQKARRIISITQATETLIQSVAPLTPIVTIPRPIDEKLWCGEEPKPDKPFIMATMTRLETGKNVQGVLDIVKRLNDSGMRDWQYWIFGDGECRQSLEASVKTMGLKANVTFWGMLGADELVRKIRAVHLQVFISLLDESFGRVYVEAAALGIPSIGYETPGSKAAVLEGQSGFLVQRGDEARVAELIRQFYDSREMLESFSTCAREFYQRTFTTEIIGRQILSELQQVASVQPE